MNQKLPGVKNPVIESSKPSSLTFYVPLKASVKSAGILDEIKRSCVSAGEGWSSYIPVSGFLLKAASA
jgi:hypothetical protein